MSAIIVAAISVAALVWLVVENAGLNDQNRGLRGERDLWKRRAKELAAEKYDLATQLEEANAPLATIHHLPQVQRVAEVLAANEAKRNLTDERLNEVTEEWGGDAS